MTKWRYAFLLAVMLMGRSTPVVYAQTSSASDALILQDNSFVQGVYHKNGNFIVLTKTGYHELNPEDGKGWRSYAYKKNELDTALLYYNNLNYVPTTTGTYFLLNGGGNVYSFQDSSLLRIDQSFPHKNQHNSGYFFHQNKIYNYGGYGFFTQKDYMTEFSLKNPQWFIYGYHETSSIPPPRDNMVYQYDAKHGNFFIASGEVNPNPSLVGSTKERLQDVWKLHLKSRKWKKLGFIPKHNLVLEIARPLHANGQFYVLQTEQNKRLYAIDIAQNTIRAYNGKNNFNHRINALFAPIYSPKNNRVLAVLLPEVKNNYKEFIFQSIPLAELQGYLLYSRPFYYPIWWFVVAGLLCIILPIATIYGYRRLRVVRSISKSQKSVSLVLNLDHATLWYEGNPLPFDLEHMQVIIHFYKNNWELTNAALLDAVRIGQESQEALKKRKSRLLDEINQRFSFTTRLSDPLIIEMKDQSDRRYKEFSINPVYTAHIEVVE